MSETQPPQDKQHISLPRKLGYASDALADNLIMNAFSGLVLPVYNIALFVDPALLGWAMAIPRIFDGFTDPLMGHLSDNTRSRWGRRKPYIVIGAVLCAIFLPVLWMSPGTSERSVFWWLTIVGLLYFLSYTVFIIPYQALGFEMTTDYDERSRLLAWPNYVGLSASVVMPWLPRSIQFAVFGGPVRGAIWVSVILGLVILVCGILPALTGREIARAEQQIKVSLGKTLKMMLSNRAFLIVVIANVIVLTGLAAFLNLSLYVNIFVVYGGSRAAGAFLTGVTGSVYAVTSYVSVFIATWIATRFGKKVAAQLLLALTLVGVLSLWVTLRPDFPYLQVVSTVIMGLGLQGTWLAFYTMIGDVCEEDELHSGLRREGIFSAVGGFSRKVAVAVSAILGGYALNLIGFDAAKAAGPGISPHITEQLKTIFIVGQAVVVLAGFVVISFYPISRTKALATQEALQKRRALLAE